MTVCTYDQYNLDLKYGEHDYSGVNGDMCTKLTLDDYSFFQSVSFTQAVIVCKLILLTYSWLQNSTRKKLASTGEIVEKRKEAMKNKIEILKVFTEVKSGMNKLLQDDKEIIKK